MSARTPFQLLMAEAWRVSRLAAQAGGRVDADLSVRLAGLAERLRGELSEHDHARVLLWHAVLHALDVNGSDAWAAVAAAVPLASAREAQNYLPGSVQAEPAYWFEVGQYG